MLKSFLTSISRSYGTKSTKNTPQRIGYTVQASDAGNGSSPRIYTPKMERSTACALVVKPKCVVYVTANGMEARIVPRMRKRRGFLKLQNKLAGNDAIAVEQWLS
jgi:hypothetical protein